MGRVKSQKIESWVSKDVVLVAITYIVNLLIIGALFLVAVELTDGIKEYFGKNVTTPIHFFIMLWLVLAVMLVYFIFEEKNFLKIASNSEMLFLIIEISLIICFATGEYVSIYLRPLALAAIMTLFLVNRRTAIFMNFIFCIKIKSFVFQHIIKVN